ncbi:MAG TPA: hypothetical protein VII19_06160 [Acidimicrobiales bacterium]
MGLPGRQWSPPAALGVGIHGEEAPALDDEVLETVRDASGEQVPDLGERLDELGQQLASADLVQCVAQQALGPHRPE